MKLNIVRLGRMDYGKALEVQEKLLSLRQQDIAGDTLLLVEHPPVLTLGRRADSANILVPEETLRSMGIGIYEVTRGGDVTYHGPGQIVGYPIMHLGQHGRDIKAFVEKVKDVFIRLLSAQFGISARGEDGKYTGVWVENDKITAIGIAVKRWVTMHGFAFNVNTNLEHFKLIRPCGIADRGVTSLEKLLGRPQDMEVLYGFTARYFCEVFGFEPVEEELGRLVPDWTG